MLSKEQSLILNFYFDMQNKTMNCPHLGRCNGKLGYFISLFGVALILLWIGLFKFTPTEAKAIQPLIAHHPLTFWMYDVFSLQAVSNLVGIVEILTALALIVGLKLPYLLKYAGWAMVVTFLMTLSYLFTTPGVWRNVDGFPITDFFILKDLVLLGFGVMLVTGENQK
ncbi:hypothetical protein CAPN009_13470 [Capnocytophaga canimorsus]|nr:hypothetical protein CAPN009_13470 [Capnocytophaga canimorsus]